MRIHSAKCAEESRVFIPLGPLEFCNKGLATERVLYTIDHNWTPGNLSSQRASSLAGLLYEKFHEISLLPSKRKNVARCSKISTAVPHLALGSSAIVSAGLGTNFRCLSSVLSGDQMAFISGKDLWRRGSPNWSFVHLSPGFLPLCLGQMAGFPQLLSACFCLLRLCGTNGCCFRKVSLDGCPSCFVHFVPHSPCST